MVRKLFLKISSLLYKVHTILNNRFKENSSFKPYILDYKPSTSKTKIIHINGNFVVGGSTQLIVDIIERTSDKFSHSVIVPDFPDPLPYQPISIHKYSLMEMIKLLDFLKRENPRIVHIHYWTRYIHRYEGFALWYETVFKICEELKINVIQNVNVPTEPYSNKAVLHNVFVSKYVLDNFNNTSVRSSVIYPGSNFSHFKNDDIEAISSDSIGMVYRLDQDKLNEKSIEVFISVVKKAPQIKCYIIGGGYYLDYYKCRVAEEQLKDNFVFTGFIGYKLLPDYYKKIGVFVAPVHDESFGQVTPFAMSMGLPVTGYDIGALSEILGNKETLVAYGDINGLADMIIDLNSNADKRKEIGLFNQKRAHELFSVEKMVEDYSNLYQQYIN